MKQTAIPRQLRDEMLVEVGHHCVRCLSKAPEVDLHHITPVSAGGLSVRENLVVLCPTCHRLAHRYKFSGRQLKLYERQAILRRRPEHAHAQPEWQRTSEYSRMQRDDLLKRLAYHTKAWYNGFVTTVVRATAAQDTTEARHVIAEYVFSREHLPDVVAIKVLLDRDKALQSLANDVEVFIRLLVRVDPAGAYMCVVRELRDIPDITEDWSNGRYDYTELPENDLVVSLQRQVQVITNQIYEIRFGSEGAVP